VGCSSDNLKDGETPTGTDGHTGRVVVPDGLQRYVQRVSDGCKVPVAVPGFLEKVVHGLCAVAPALLPCSVGLSQLTYLRAKPQYGVLQFPLERVDSSGQCALLIFVPVNFGYFLSKKNGQQSA
jgi:hypothetical protein